MKANNNFGILIISLMVCLVSSCFSYQQTHFKRSAGKAVYPKDSIPFYVTNSREFPKEMNILKVANIIQFTKDSTVTNKIRLIRLEQVREFRCMTGSFPLMVLSLGQIPVRTPYRYKFQFETIQSTSSILIVDTLMIDKRVWFWDVFSFKKSPYRQLGKALQESNNK